MTTPDPQPVVLRAGWATLRRLALDLALGGAALGAIVGMAALGRGGVWAVPGGAALGALVAVVAGPRRLTLGIDEGGLHIGRLAGRIDVAWPEVVALGIEDAWSGRRGRSTALGVCRRGAEWPTLVPALTFHASGFRIGGARPDDTLAPHRARIREVAAGWAEARAVPLIGDRIDDWWDRNRC